MAIPASRGQNVRWDNFLSVSPHPLGLSAFFSGNWYLYAQNPDGLDHVFGSSENSGTSILTFLGGFDPITKSLWLTECVRNVTQKFVN